MARRIHKINYSCIFDIYCNDAGLNHLQRIKNKKRKKKEKAYDTGGKADVNEFYSKKSTFF